MDSGLEVPTAVEPSIAILDPAEYDQVRGLLRELMLEEQRHYKHPQLTPAQIDRDVAKPPAPGFRGENVILAARTPRERIVGMCWCVFFDPGTGLEAEVAEIYVDPEFRSHGLGTELLKRAIGLFRERGVTFACVWTRDSNPQAVRIYEQAGFQRTEQLVLTWLPLPGR